MKLASPEVADVLRTFAADFLRTHPASAEQVGVLNLLPLCRTASLGGHRLRCDSCGHEEISYNSCRNRHCPKCRAAARAEWLEARQSELLDVPYFHVVFTLPDKLAAIALQNKHLCYGLLFRTAAETLQTIAADPKHLGARIGLLAVLHTWNQKLLHHPHIHCVVPGGGLSPDRDSWISCSERFFLPVRVLSRLFRRLYVQGLQRAYAAGELELHGRLEELRDPNAWHRTIDHVRTKEWVVYAKPPFGGPKQVLKYLARYTHRVAISNARILAIDGDTVRFRWKDRSTDGRSRTMTIPGVEFVRRFLLHILPKGFVSIRHFGFLSNRNRSEAILLIRRLLSEAHSAGDRDDDRSDASRASAEPPLEPSLGYLPCPLCQTGRLLVLEELEPGHPALHDTS